MGIPIRRTVLSAGLVLATALAGCSSSDDDGSPQSTDTAGGGICDRVSPGQGIPATGSDKKAVEKVFHLFFSTDTSFAKSMAVLQHGQEFCPSLAAVNNTSYGKQKTAADVASVRLKRPEVAAVTFTIRVANQVVLPDAKGYAVVEDGNWKVAAVTFCQLLTLQGSAPSDCDDSDFIALPG